MEKIKYPHTPHFPWSRSKTDDDRILKNARHFEGKKIIITEKMDGENTTMTREFYHARSLDSADHLSQHYVKAIHGSVKHWIPEGWRICGENVYASHSIFYKALPSYFLVFSIWNEKNICLSWEETLRWCQKWGLVTVPVLYTGIWAYPQIHSLCYTQKSQCGGEQEGYVVRMEDAFEYNHFDKSVAKFVRPKHVQTNKHWKRNKVIPNKLKRA